MAAMPAMGMAAMRAEGATQEQSGGGYEAAVELQNGGTWSMTIAASKDGQPIAVKQADVSATGPMSM